MDVRNGEGYGPPDSTYESYDVRVETVASGDLTGDSNPEAAVLLYCAPQPSNFFSQDVQVFTDGAQLLAQLPELSPLPDGLDLTPLFDPDEFLIRSGQLVTGVDYYSATDSHASGPSIHRVLTWQWDGSQFTAEPEPDQYQPEQSQSPTPSPPDTTAAPPETTRQDDIDPAAGDIGIASTAGWQQTPLTLQQGDEFEIPYAGDGWTVDYRNFPYVGPEGYAPDVDEQIYQGCRLVDSLPYATLLGQVGDGEIFAVGEGGEFTADASGALSLRINDDDACLGDNAGELVLDEPKLVAQQGSSGSYQYDSATPQYAP